MASTFKSNFQRSQSKVWWAQPPERAAAANHYGFLSLPLNNNNHQEPSRTSAKPAHSPIMPKEVSGTSWSYRRGSPGSLKSHDSGFSDSDHSSPPTTATASTKTTPCQSPETINLSSSSSRSPSVTSSCERQTPPTVIRKKINNIGQQHQQQTARRISFSAPSSPIYERIDNDSGDAAPSIFNRIDSFRFDNTSPAASNSSLGPECKCSPIAGGKSPTKLRRRPRLLKCVSRLSIDSTDNYYCMAPESSANRPPSAHHQQSINENEPDMMMQTSLPQIATPQTPPTTSQRDYHNETVVFGCGAQEIHPRITSTPKSHSTTMPTTQQQEQQQQHRASESRIEMLDLTPHLNWQSWTFVEYVNPVLNGHAASVQFWLDETRTMYAHEVLSTLQTKPVSKTPAAQDRITSATAGKLIRQLQSKAVILQYEFDRLENVFRQMQSDREADDDDDELIKAIPTNVKRLHGSIMNFVRRLEVNDLSATITKNVRAIIDMSYDLEGSSQEVDDFVGLCDEVQILKRHLLITVRLVLEQYMNVIVDRLETVQCDLIVRSNLCMLSMLSNMEYTGLASLAEVFISTRVVRVLLAICVETKLSSARSLALRALASICCCRETIRQFQVAGGLDILREIIEANAPAGDGAGNNELKEALSVLAQITAPWHGRDHRIVGLTALADCLVERISAVATATTAATNSQTLLLAVATLNNLSRMEVTAAYSLMANETVVRLRAVIEAKRAKHSIFLYVSWFFLLFRKTLESYLIVYSSCRNK